MHIILSLRSLYNIDASLIFCLCIIDKNLAKQTHVNTDDKSEHKRARTMFDSEYRNMDCSLKNVNKWTPLLLRYS